MVEITAPHSIEYTMEEGLTLGEIAESLLAQQVLVDRLPLVLEELFPGLTVDAVRIRLKIAETGSLKEEFIVSLFLAFQDDVEESIIKAIEGTTGLDILEQHKTVVTLLVILVVLYVARAIYERVIGKRGEGAEKLPAIQGDYNTVLNITADRLQVSSESLDDAVAVAAASRDSRGLVSAIRRFFAPAKRGGGSTIKAHGEPVISREAVREFPSEAVLEDIENEPVMEPLAGVRLRILALDRQRRRTGWACAFPDGEVDRSRVTMDLYPTVPLDDLSRAEEILADVIVEYDAANTLHARRVHLLKVIKVIY